jgi:lysophospholipase L1-like esterase
MRATRVFRWLTITTTLLVALGLGLSGTAHAGAGPQWVSAWGFSQQGLAPATDNVTNATVRMITRPTLSGSAVRVTLQNTFGEEPVEVGAAYVGLRANGALLVPGSNHPLTFAGAPNVTIPPRGEVISDPASLEVRAQQDVAVSLYLPGTMVPISRHTNARVTSFRTANGVGDLTAQEAATNFTTPTTSMWWVAAVDVLAEDGASAIVCLGDSITDGTGSTIDGYDRWHDFLALRLLMDGKYPRATVNEGIGGNRINPGGASPAAVERLDRDVLSRAGVSHVIFFEGTNDIAGGGATSAQVIAGSQEIIDRVHAAGLKIIGVTMIPRHSATWTPQMTQYRHEVNDWIRNHAKFDAVIDFDEVVRDPDNPDLMNPILDLGDHVHPNPYGYLVMGRSIDLKLFEHVGPGRGPLGPPPAPGHP